MLVAREIGDWWTELPARLHEDVGQAVLRSAFGLELGAAEPTTAGRREAFAGAARAFAATLEVAVPGGIEPDLGDPLFERLLFVHLAALTSIDLDSPSRSGSLVRRDLLDDALLRERRYWRETAEARGFSELDLASLDRAVGVATLIDAATEADAVAALSDSSATFSIIAPDPSTEVTVSLSIVFDDGTVAAGSLLVLSQLCTGARVGGDVLLPRVQRAVEADPLVGSGTRRSWNRSHGISPRMT